MKGPSKQASALSPQAGLSITWTVQDLTSTSPMMAPSSTWNTRCQRPPAALPPRGRHRQHGLAPGELTLGRTPCCRSIAPLSPQGPRRKQQEQKPASRCFACGPAVAGVGGGAGSQDKYLCAPRKEGGTTFLPYPSITPERGHGHALRDTLMAHLKMFVGSSFAYVATGTPKHNTPTPLGATVCS